MFKTTIMKQILISLTILLSIFEVTAQSKVSEFDIKDSIQANELIRKFMDANRNPSYLSLMPFITSKGERRLGMRNGEGRGDNQLLEAYINLSFPIMYGRKEHNKLLALEYTGNFRMTLDDSKPLTPGSHQIGLSYYHILNQTLSPKNEDVLHFNTLRIQAKHYSNGQAPGFYYFDPNDNTNFRNSYLDGDFSTNFLSFGYTKGYYNSAVGAVHQFTLGYRWDLGTEESTFAYTAEQEKTYGRHRLSFTYDFRTKNSIIIKQRYDHHIRVNMGYILDNLDKFRPNLTNDNRKYRTNVKVTYELAPKHYYAVGYFLSGYYGRDYLNIRYDDIIYSFQFGITLNPEKLFM